MEVFKRTISAVFSGERRYLIPLFQRPYVWTRENQWEPLWEDIVERAQHELDQPKAETPPHFLGAIVIQQRSSWGDELLAHDVIDGQQRLTTFQILLTALRDVAIARDEKQIAASAVAWTRNSNPIADPEVEQFKVWPSGRDLEQFRLVTTAGSKTAIEIAHPAVYKRKRLQPRPRMVEAYLFFHEKITDWLDGNGAVQASERLRVLRRVFDKRMQLVSIELGQEEDPQAIFETLNARGVPLLASDLLRNYIFQRAANPGDAARLHARYWARFEVPDDPGMSDGPRFWEVEVRQGRLNRARLDLFVQHYLTMKRGAEVLTGHLFPTYKAWIEGDKPFETLDAELREFTRMADHFVELLRPSTSSATGRFARRLHALDTSTVYPLVLGLIGNAALPAADRDGIFQDIESFLVRRLICGRPAKNYNRQFLQLLRDFDLGPPSRGNFRALLAAGTGDAVDWPDDTAFEAAWLTIDAYRDLKPLRVEMILRAIDDGMRTSNTEALVLPEKLTVEHVLPQEWQLHWPLASDSGEREVEARDDVVHDFGNLTLLTGALNSSVSNGPAAQKLPKIALDSALRLNKTFQNRTTWTEADIAERGRSLFQVARRIWPGP